LVAKRLELLREPVPDASVIDSLKRALAATDGLDPDLGPRWHRIDAHFVGIRAEILRCREGGGDIVPPRSEVAQQDNRFALLYVAELKFLPEQHCQFGVIDGLVHGGLLCVQACTLAKFAAKNSLFEQRFSLFVSENSLFCNAGNWPGNH
jgi:hypothetical protein